MAWDVTGDQKTAIRASGGIFYNFINRAQYLYNGGPLISSVRQVLNSTLRRARRRRPVGPVRRKRRSRATSRRATRCRCTACRLPQGKLQPEKNYQANVAFQRDIGFKTVAEVA